MVLARCSGVHLVVPAIWENEVGGSLRDQLGTHKETQSQNKKKEQTLPQGIYNVQHT
jgi:hypothetical protein